jgi:hypothetical protein
MASLSPEFHAVKEENPDRVAQADLVVGLLAHNDEATVEKVASKYSEGLAQDFPEARAALVLSDRHSEDRTVEAFFRAPTGPPKLAVVAPPDRRQETQGLFNLFLVAERLGAKMVVVQGADAMTVKRTWLKRLVKPLADGVADFANPLYARNAIDAPVTNLMVYPLVRALFGRRLRQPVLTDWAFNDKVLAALLACQNWPDLPGPMAPDLNAKVLAATGGFRICQTIMTEGRYGLSNERLDTPHIIRLFRELAQGVFEAMTRFKDYWPKVVRSRPTSVVGTDLKPGLYPVRYEVSLEELYGEIHALLKAAEPEWRELLAPMPGGLGQHLKEASLSDLCVTVKEWGAFLFHCGQLYETLDPAARQRLISAMTPVFLARFLTFQKQTLGLSVAQVEAKVEEAAEGMEKLKKELLGPAAAAAP